jgi:hypothetical protein
MNTPEIRLIDRVSSFVEARKRARETNSCVGCDNPITEFKDEISKKEYQISLLCQACQDEFFGDSPEDEEDDEESTEF